MRANVHSTPDSAWFRFSPLRYSSPPTPGCAWIFSPDCMRSITSLGSTSARRPQPTGGVQDVISPMGYSSSPQPTNERCSGVIRQKEKIMHVNRQEQHVPVQGVLADPAQLRLMRAGLAVLLQDYDSTPNHGLQSNDRRGGRHHQRRPGGSAQTWHTSDPIRMKRNRQTW